ncbi:MAG: hypothetical protein CMH69_15875 [Nitratireductor sp.]|nr:hypothetical protein [Nitratireductor sp.]
MPVFWSPEEDSSVVILTDVPSLLPSDSDFSTPLDANEPRLDGAGAHFLYDLGNGQSLHLVRLIGVDGAQPLAALVPLDADSLDRVEAVSRLVKALHGRAVPQDARLTEQQLRRARHMLQAVDGRTNGASYREIAEALFGVRRVADQPWKTSALRDTVKDLVRDGLAMIQGGYRQLLRHRRRS